MAMKLGHSSQRLYFRVAKCFRTGVLDLNEIGDNASCLVGYGLWPVNFVHYQTGLIYRHSNS